MTDKAVKWAVSSLKTMTLQQKARVKRYLPKGKPLTAQQQIERYQQGAERWRLDSGLVSPEEWQQYETAMQALMQEGV